MSAFADDVPDIKLDNIQNTLPNEEDASLTSFVNAERTEPSTRKCVDEIRTIYTTRQLDYGDIMTFPILSDLGTCSFGQDEYKGLIQAMPYRAPEVILKLNWNCAVDVWDMGVLIRELLFAEPLFGNDNEDNSLAMMITYLGPPPSELLEQSPLRVRDFDNHGDWKGSNTLPIPLEDRLEGVRDIGMLLDFIRSMLQWVPGKRKTAAEILGHSSLKLQ